MTRNEELQYLFDLINEASKWRLSEGDDRDSLRMEVEQRIDKLLNRNVIVHDDVEVSFRTPTQTETETTPVIRASSASATTDDDIEKIRAKNRRCAAKRKLRELLEKNGLSFTEDLNTKEFIVLMNDTEVSRVNFYVGNHKAREILGSLLTK